MTTVQMDLFTARQNRDAGISQAVTHANQVTPNWSERIWTIFIDWLNAKPKGYYFLTEDFRLHVECQKLIERPPSNRAFGFLTPKAAKMGLIYQNGTRKVKNPNANCANAAVWVKK